MTVVVRTPDYHIAYSTVRIGSVGIVGFVMAALEKFGGKHGISVSTARYAIHGKAEVKALQRTLKVWESTQSDLTALEVAEKRKLGMWSSKEAITKKAARRNFV